MPPAPTLTQIQSLLSSTTTAASGFTSYPFRQFFLARTRATFEPVLGAIAPAPGSVPAEPPHPAELAAWYAERQRELEVLKRAGKVNAIYGGKRLVVEDREITSGGGAGMEASAGGGGQTEGV
ncbi:hypothetical protein Q5752_005200 [Cryptotrichosporon argae]